MPSAPPRHPPRRLCALLLPLLLGSCATMGLWGYEWQDDPDGPDGEGSYVAVEGTRWEWWRVLLRVAATPITVALDVPVALIEGVVAGVLDGDTDADDCHPHSRRRDDGPRLAPTRAPARSEGGSPMVGGVRR